MREVCEKSSSSSAEADTVCECRIRYSPRRTSIESAYKITLSTIHASQHAAARPARKTRGDVDRSLFPRQQAPPSLFINSPHTHPFHLFSTSSVPFTSPLLLSPPFLFPRWLPTCATLTSSPDSASSALTAASLTAMSRQLWASSRAVDSVAADMAAVDMALRDALQVIQHTDKPPRHTLHCLP